MQKPGFEKLPLGTQTLPPGFPAPFLFGDGLSSVDTLLTNIQVHAVCVLCIFVRNSSIVVQSQCIYTHVRNPYAAMYLINHNSFYYSRNVCSSIKTIAIEGKY